MMNHFDEQSCERFGPLISARIDNELELAASLQLDQHLEMCAECRQRAQIFRQIDSCVFAASDWDGKTIRVPVTPNKSYALAGRQTGHKIRGGFLMRWIPLATAATVLIGLIVVALPDGPSVTAEQIALPLAELEWINAEQNENQVRMLKTLEFELRVLKLELNSFGDDWNGDTSSADKMRVEETLNRLIERVKHFGDNATN